MPNASAVSAILAAGHIPAGLESFTAGDLQDRSAREFLFAVLMAALTPVEPKAFDLTDDLKFLRQVSDFPNVPHP